MQQTVLTLSKEYREKKPTSWVIEAHRKCKFPYVPKTDNQRSKDNAKTWGDDPCFVSEKNMIEVEYDDAIASVLDASGQLILKEFVTHIKDYVKQELVTVNNITVSDFDNLDGSHDIVVSVIAHADSEVAMQLWNRIGVSVGEWLSKQSEPTRKLVREKFSTEVCWQSDTI